MFCWDRSRQPRLASPCSPAASREGRKDESNEDTSPVQLSKQASRYIRRLSSAAAAVCTSLLAYIHSIALHACSSSSGSGAAGWMDGSQLSLSLSLFLAAFFHHCLSFSCGPSTSFHFFFSSSDFGASVSYKSHGRKEGEEREEDREERERTV